MLKQLYVGELVSLKDGQLHAFWSVDRVRLGDNVEIAEHSGIALSSEWRLTHFTHTFVPMLIRSYNRIDTYELSKYGMILTHRDFETKFFHTWSSDLHIAQTDDPLSELRELYNAEFFVKAELLR